MRRSTGPLLLIFLGIVSVFLFLLLREGPADPTPDDTPAAHTPGPIATRPALSQATPVAGASPTPTPQPIYPTPTEAPADSDPGPSAPPPNLTPDPRRCPLPDCLSRSGVSGRLEDIAAAAEAGLPFGNFFDWWLNADPPAISGSPAGEMATYWQMVPVSQDGPRVSWSQIEEVVAARPGSNWIVGNEPDVTWQDNTTAEAYAAIYHDVYTFIKERDPAAQIAIAGVAQPSPLRLAYLEQVLATYQDRYGASMPVDIWTVHAFILREQAGSWGVGIPPGMDQDQGLLYELTDHDDLAIFKESLVTFRAWMAEQGYGDKPLAVTEFGILHPADYGFPSPAVIDFMIGASDFMATASDEHGLPEDEQRLVQNWFWFSVHDHGDFPTGNLVDLDQGRLTPVGQAFSYYLGGP